MKKLTLALAVLIVAGAVSMRPASAGVSFDFFFSSLSPHGHWGVSASFGHVWQPAVYHPGWNPYYDGRWQYTDVGWAWNSDYAWGAIPYHYGTWVMDPAMGWVWVPGYTYAPSWVTFREGPDYIGWAPVAPSFSVGFSFNAGFPAPSSFVYVHSHDFLCDHVHSYAVPYNNVIVNNTRIINNNIRIENNTIVNRGPDVHYVERATRRHIDTIPIEQTRSIRELGSRGFSREDFRVSDRGGRGRVIRAAEPIPGDRPLPSRRSGGEDRAFRGGDQRGGDQPDARAYRGGDQRDSTYRGRDRDMNGNGDRAAGEPSRSGGPDRSDAIDRSPYRSRATREGARGRDRQETGSYDRADMGRGREPAYRPGPYSNGPDRNDADRSAPSRMERGRPPQDYPSRADRERSPRPDEGRVFRGVRERQPAPQAQRSMPELNGGGPDRSRDRSARERSGEATRGGHHSERPRGHKEHDRN